MQLIKIENSSSMDVELHHKNGAKTILPPKAGLIHINIVNLHELEGKVKATPDLTEITSSGSGKILYG